VIEIAFLAGHPDCIPTLARWFRDEWPGYYGDRPLADIEDDFRRESHRDVLPIRLVAFEDGVLAGTAVLRDSALDGHEDYSPGLGGLYVHPSMRSRGVASALIAACTRLAGELDLGDLYTATATAQGLVERLGWRRIATLRHESEKLAIYRFRADP
jgi:GNAT superfamily N-acetyltransferase